MKLWSDLVNSWPARKRLIYKLNLFVERQGTKLLLFGVLGSLVESIAAVLLGRPGLFLIGCTALVAAGIGIAYRLHKTIQEYVSLAEGSFKAIRDQLQDDLGERTVNFNAESKDAETAESQGSP